MLSRWLLRRMDNIDPERRRIWAAKLVWCSLAGWLLSAVMLVVLRQSTFFNQMLLAISWLAITFTGIDVLSTNDVRTQQDGYTSPSCR